MIVLAGDIMCATKEFPKLPKDKLIIYLPGNHEYYHRVFPDYDQEIEDFLSEEYPLAIYVAQRRVIWIQDVCFVCTPLWSDCRGQTHDLFHYSIADFQVILKSDGWPLRVEDIAKEYELNCEFIEEEAVRARQGEGAARKVVVVTHFPPSRKAIAPYFKGQPTNSYFCPDAETTVVAAGADVWLYGHTHSSINFNVGHTEFHANPRGYVIPRQARGNPKFKDNYIIEV